MSWSEADIRSNRDYFKAKLSAIKQRNTVLEAIQHDAFDFVLLDTRPRDAFKFGHITGAWCAPFVDFETIIPRLPKDREIVTYCWGHD
jgi:rhodanese-related sulfurtransferase